MAIPVAKRPRTIEDKGDSSKDAVASSSDPIQGVVVKTQAGDDVLVVPTTEELRARIDDPVALSQIAKYRRDAMQRADEKVAIAEQTFAIVDAAIRRLDRDIGSFET